MHVRLAFSVMIQVDADILLIDEVLAVGDAAFQQKCFDEFERIRRSGHDGRCSSRTTWASVERFCDRAMLLEHGARRRARRARSTSAMRYLRAELLSDARGRAEAEAARRAETDERASALGDGRAEIVDGVVRGRARRARRGPRAGGALRRSHARCASTADVEDPSSPSRSSTRQTRTVFGATTQHTDPTPGRFAAGEEVTLRFALRQRPRPRTATALSAAVARAGSGMDCCDRRERVRVGHGRRHDRPPAASSTCPYEIDVQRGAGTREEAVGVSAVAADVEAIRGVGTEVTGPTALGNDPRRAADR